MGTAWHASRSFADNRDAAPCASNPDIDARFPSLRAAILSIPGTRISAPLARW